MAEECVVLQNGCEVEVVEYPGCSVEVIETTDCICIGGGGGGGTVDSVIGGINVVVNSTDPANPIVNVPSIGVESIIPGQDIAVDATDPANPIVSAPNVINKTEWISGGWVPGVYSRGQQVLDSGWLAICIVDFTSERPAPQDNGLPSYYLPDDPAWDAPATSTANVVWTGHDVTITTPGWLRKLRVWVPQVTPSTHYHFVVVDITNPLTPIYQSIEEDKIVPGEWNTIILTNAAFREGTVLRIYIDAVNLSSETPITGQWVGAGNTGTPPLNGTWTISGDGLTLRFADLDDAGVDRQAELLSVVPNTTIKIADAVTATDYNIYLVTQAPTDGTGWVGYTVQLIETSGAGSITGLADVLFQVPNTAAVEYEEAIGWWLTSPQPNWATVIGFKAFDGVPQAGVENNAYGIDIQFQPAYLSPDWDLQSNSSVNGGGGGGGGSGLIVINTDTTFHVDWNTGSDTTGDGTLPSPFKTPNRALQFIEQFLIIDNAVVTISCAAGDYLLTEPMFCNNTNSERIQIVGAALTGVINGTHYVPRDGVYPGPGSNEFLASSKGAGSSDSAANVLLIEQKYPTRFRYSFSTYSGASYGVLVGNNGQFPYVTNIAFINEGETGNYVGAAIEVYNNATVDFGQIGIFGFQYAYYLYGSSKLVADGIDNSSSFWGCIYSEEESQAEVNNFLISGADWIALYLTKGSTFKGNINATGCAGDAVYIDDGSSAIFNNTDPVAVGCSGYLINAVNAEVKSIDWGCSVYDCNGFVRAVASNLNMPVPFLQLCSLTAIQMDNSVGNFQYLGIANDGGNATISAVNGSQILIGPAESHYSYVPALGQLDGNGNIIYSDSTLLEIPNSNLGSTSYTAVDMAGGTVVDTSLGTIFKKTITTDTIITFNVARPTSTIIYFYLTNGAAFNTTFPGVIWAKGTDPVFKVAGTDLIVFFTDGANIYGSSLSQSGSLFDLANVGTGEGTIYRDEIGGVANLKTLKAGANVVITNNADEIQIDATGAGGGEANTSSNSGTGAGLALPKVGVDLPFKSLTADGSITITVNASDLQISVNTAGVSHAALADLAAIDQHPIEAIIGLVAALAGKLGTGEQAADSALLQGQTGLFYQNRVNHIGVQAPNTVTFPNDGAVLDMVDLEHFYDHSWSAGITDGGIVTQGTGSAVNVTAFEAVFRTGLLEHDPLIAMAVDAVSELATPTYGLIFADYNAGVPIVRVEPAGYKLNLRTEIPLAATTYDSVTGVNYTVNFAQYNTDFTALVNRRLIDQGIAHVPGTTQLSETGVQNINITASKFYFGIQSVTDDAFDTSLTDRFTYWYSNGAGGWNRQSLQAQISVTQYDNGSGTLANITNNRFSQSWVYMLLQDGGSEVHVIYGTENATDPNVVIAASPPAVIPPVLGLFGVLIGRCIVEEGVTTFHQVENAFAEEYNPGQVTVHNTLAGLQGGAPDDYFHVTSAQIAYFETIPAQLAAKVSNIIAGANITVDSTDPENPIVASTAVVAAVIGGTNVTVDATDPQNPIVNVPDVGTVDSVVAGTNVTVNAADPANPIVSVPVIGEINTASNEGVGEPLALAKVGANLPFKTLLSDATIDLTATATELSISVSALVVNAIAAKLASVIGGTNVTIDNTDPQNPIINVPVIGGQVDSVVAGANITVDNTDPANPIVASTGGGSGSTVWIDSVPPVDTVAYPQWFNTVTTKMYIWYNDGSSSQWVEE